MLRHLTQKNTIISNPMNDLTRLTAKKKPQDKKMFLTLMLPCQMIINVKVMSVEQKLYKHCARFPSQT